MCINHKICILDFFTFAPSPMVRMDQMSHFRAKLQAETPELCSKVIELCFPRLQMRNSEILLTFTSAIQSLLSISTSPLIGYSMQWPNVPLSHTSRSWFSTVPVACAVIYTYAKGCKLQVKRLPNQDCNILYPLCPGANNNKLCKGEEGQASAYMNVSVDSGNIVTATHCLSSFSSSGYVFTLAIAI